MDNQHSIFSEAAQETEMLNASSPSPQNPSVYYVIFSSKGRSVTAAKFETHSVEACHASKRQVRRDYGSDARPKGAPLPLPAALASLPLASPLLQFFRAMGM